MTKRYHMQTERLKKMILHLTAMVEENLRAAVKAITERDVDLAAAVVAKDDEIDQYEVEVEEEVLKILALYQPVAIDLRFIIAVLKINNDLERIGDLAVNISQRAAALGRTHKRVPVPFDLAEMLRLAVDMVRRSSDALVAMDPQIARRVLIEDDDLDDLRAQAFTAVREKIAEQPDAVEYLLNLLSVSRNLERIGDHATNIAEDVIYMVEGDIVRHRGNDV